MTDVAEKLTAEQQVARDELDGAFRDLLKLASGKRVLFWILEQCAIYEDAYAGEVTNATNYTLGRQASGRRVIDKLNEIDPRFYPQLLMDIADIRAIDRAAANTLAGSQGNDDDVDA